MDEVRPGFFEDLREVATDVWRAHELLYQLTRRDLAIRYKQAVMGFGWALFTPLLIVLSGSLVRVAMATLSGASVSVGELAGMTLKAIGWAFFAGAIGTATNSLLANMNLITKVAFPREVLPLSAVVAQAFDCSIALAAASIALVAFGSVAWTAALLWVPVLLVMLIAFTVMVALLLSCANLFFRDIKYIVQVLLNFGVFFTPVLYEPAMLGPKGAKLIFLNPLSPMLEGLRLVVVDGANLFEPILTTAKNGATVVAWDPIALLWSALWIVVGLPIVAVVFHRAEFLFAERI